MKLRYSKKAEVFYCEASYQERHAPKQAGFWFHWARSDKCRDGLDCNLCKAGLGKVWWSPREACAARLVEYADDDAKEQLAGHIETVEKSKATDNGDVNIPKPDGLDYLPFQKAGIAYALDREATLIGDEMGLGKTIQGLGVINGDDSIKTVMIIVPASLRINWKREAEKWLVRDFAIHVVEKNVEVPADADIVIVNFDMLKGKVLQSIESRKFDLLIVDECHKVKNPKAKRTKTVLGYYDRDAKERVPGLVDNCKRRVFLTGTPFLNRPIEIQPIAGALDPRQFGNFFTFAKRYCNAHRGRYGWDFSGASNLAELQERLRGSVMVRRLKKDVLTELPPKRRQVITLARNGAAKAVKAEAKAFEKHEAELERLRQDVDLAHAAGNDDEYKAAVAKLKDAAQLAFTEISAARKAVAVAKLPSVFEHLDSMIDSGIEKLIVFAHHHEVVDKLMEHLGDKAVKLTGRDKQDDRQDAVDRFQNDDSVQVFVGSIQAAGVGLTLTASANVVFVELDWVPANVTQAEDRAHRIGQTNHVLVQHLVVDGSLDARMAQVLVHKQNLADQALDLDTSIVVVPEETDGRKPRPRKYPVATDEQRKAAAEGLQRLANVCDGARERDGCGFNGIDTHTGKSLALSSLAGPLTDGQVWLARRILPKYHRQVGEDLLAALKGPANETSKPKRGD